MRWQWERNLKEVYETQLGCNKMYYMAFVTKIDDERLEGSTYER